MDKIMNEIIQLTATINHHNHLYHSLDKPEINDVEFDQLLLKLRQYEQEYPEFVQANSPTKTVGSKASKAFTSVKHDKPMLSLANAFSLDDLLAFNKRELFHQNLVGNPELMGNDSAFEGSVIDSKTERMLTLSTTKLGIDVCMFVGFEIDFKISSHHVEVVDGVPNLNMQKGLKKTHLVINMHECY